LRQIEHLLRQIEQLPLSGGIAQDRWNWSSGLTWRCEIAHVYGL